MTWSEGISGVQRRIAEERRSPVQVLAGPGTGKTFAMMRRIARLLEDGVPGDEILAATFTRTAARDLREQLKRLGSPGADRVHAMTLHSLCFRVLAEQEVFTATGRTARPLMSYEISQMVNDIAPSFGGKKAVKRHIAAYEAAWARMQHDDAGAARTSADQAFEAALKEWLIYHRAMLIGELVPIALGFMRQNPTLEVLPHYRAVLADEYQDLNRADQALVEELARSGELTVVGDDNQSIYSFRYAHPEGIRVFAADHPGASRGIVFSP